MKEVTHMSPLETLLREEESLTRQIRDLQSKREGILYAISLLKKGDFTNSPTLPLMQGLQTRPAMVTLTPRHHESGIATVLALINQTPTGLTFADIINKSKELGVELVKSTISSQLSKAVAKGKISRIGDKYMPRSI